jgi:hypothetical protein
MPNQLIHRIQHALTPDLLKKDQVSMLTGIHPTEGHCAVAAEAAYHLLGGKDAGWVPVVLPKSVLGNNTHWWIENRITGERVDPTAEQFGGDPIPYHRGVRCGFMCPVKGQPSKRARIVIDRVKGMMS